jgi:hypothetical protein
MTDTQHLLNRLESLLTEGMSAEGENLEAKLSKLGNDDLPDDLLELLQNLIQAHTGGDANEKDPLEFAFQCGQAYERLESLVHSRLAANIAYHSADGTPPMELERKDFDRLARFITLRNQVLKTIADYTLKFLLVSVVLLAIGLALGLI